MLQDKSLTACHPGASLAPQPARPVLISGMDRMEFLETNLELAMKFEPMSAAEKQALLARVKPLAGPEIEYYKKQVTRDRPA